MINTNSYVEKLVPCSRYKKFGSITLGILSWGNLIDPNSYIDYTVENVEFMYFGNA